MLLSKDPYSILYNEKGVFVNSLRHFFIPKIRFFRF